MPNRFQPAPLTCNPTSLPLGHPHPSQLLKWHQHASSTYNTFSRSTVAVVAFMGHMLSTIEKWHCQPTEAVAGHLPVWSGCTVTMVSSEMVYLCAVTSWQFESWLPYSGVIHMGIVDHRGRFPVMIGDVQDWQLWLWNWLHCNAGLQQTAVYSIAPSAEWIKWSMLLPSQPLLY